MSLEDFALRFEGLDPMKINAIITDIEHLIDVVKQEMPRIERTLTAIRSQLAAYQANQRRFR